MGDVNRYGSVGYLVNATPKLLELYPEMTVYVKASHFDAAQSELAALREELAEIKESLAYRGSLLNRTQQRAEAAEQRNAELVELLRSIKRHDPDTQCMSYPMHRRIDAALKPTESGASE